MIETAGLAELIEVDELDRGACLRLLAGGVIGRVVSSEAAMPAARPVTYVVDGGEIVFRAAAGSALALATHHTVVAFEADEIDRRALTGWTVLGVGWAYPIIEPARLSGLQSTSGTPSGSAVTVAVRLQRLTGRLLRPDSPGDPGPGVLRP